MQDRAKIMTDARRQPKKQILLSFYVFPWTMKSVSTYEIPKSVSETKVRHSVGIRKVVAPMNLKEKDKKHQKDGSRLDAKDYEGF